MSSRKLLVILLAVVFIIGAVGSAGASSSYVNSFSSTYPGSATASFGCSICHTSAPTRNAYGTAFGNAGHNYKMIEAQDSDGDGATNITEINAGTNPGSSASKPPSAPVACTGYTYSAWSACGSNGQQTRTVLSNTPAGCTGTPATPAVLTQACSTGPVACTGYNYSAWSACGSNGQQTRTVISNAPAGCTGTPATPAVLTQACSTGPVACTGYNYSAWSACGSNGQQTRTVVSNAPAGCTGAPATPAVLTQACTPSTIACTGYFYSAWHPCSYDGQQTRTVARNIPANCTGTPATPPVLTQACTPPIIGGCTGYTYSAWSACGSNGQQTRTVVSNTPGGCTGTPSTAPVLAQACTPPTTGACTGYTYSAWSACGSNGQQTRTVLSNLPAGCTGTPATPAVLTQACSSGPVACTGYTYSAWSACGSNGRQTRTVLSNTPAGCTGTPATAPVLSQACSTGPVACTGYTYSAWSACRSNGRQTRTVIGNTPAGCTGTPSTPEKLTRACTPPTTVACKGYTYSAWSTCSADGRQTRTVLHNFPANCTGTPPKKQGRLTKACTPPVCTAYKYSAWSTCGADGQQTRTVLHNLPIACPGTPANPPVLKQSCAQPTIDGTTLYMQRCSACHGSLEKSQVRGTTAADIKSAITGFSQMNFLSFLTDANIQAIAGALVTTTPPPPPPPLPGGPHPVDWLNQHPSFVDRNGTSSCTACHGQTLQGGTGPSCYSCHSDGGD